MAEASFSAEPGVTPLVFSVNPCYPAKVTLDSGSVKTLTEGGDEYVYQKGAGYALHYVKFEGMPAGDFDGGYDYAALTQEDGTQSLVNWFYNVAASGTFTYRDPFGRERQVSMAAGKLDFSMTDNGLYDGAITLKETLG